MDTSLFGLRFKSNAELQPDPADLAAFLRSPRVPGGKGVRQDDLAVFTSYLERVDAYENGSVHGPAREDVSDRMLLGVLSHTQFFRPAFRIAIEEYLYHHHQLLMLDFSKPEKFVRSAEEELSRLNVKKKDDQQKIARLQVLIEQRKKDLEVLTKRRHIITSELCHIAAYVRDNVVKVLQLCDSAIVSLAKLVNGKKTEQLIEDLKTHFKDEVRERRQMGTVTPEYLESLKAEVTQLSQRLARLVLGDIHAVTGVYEGFYEHAKKNAALLKDLIARAEQARKNDALRDDRPFAELESALIALISDFRPIMVKAPTPEGTGERHEDLLREKRREMLDHVFALLKEQHRRG